MYIEKCIINAHYFRTIEVNNTDAEGRLVLGDGVRLSIG